MTTISVDTEFGRREVHAAIIGPFAVHKSLFGKSVSSHYWTVTHVRTGLSVSPRLQSESVATALANALAPMADWTFDGKPKFPQDVIDRIRLEIAAAEDTDIDGVVA